MKQLLLLTVNLLFCYMGYATTWYVSADGSNTNSGLQTSPFQTITHAMSVAVENDTIHILGTIVENQIKVNKSLIIEGDNPLTSIVMGGSISPIVLMAQSTPPTLISNNRIFSIDATGVNVKFKNLTLKYGIEAGQGAAIFNNKTSSIVEVDGCNFIENYAGNQGGAISTNKELVIRNSSFIGNESATHAGAVNNNPAGLPLTIENSLFYDNKANSTGTGGAIRTNSQAIRFINNTLVNNHTSTINKIEGINIYSTTGSVDFHNNILFNNKGGRDDRNDGEDFSIGDLTAITLNAHSNIVSFIHSAASRVPFTINGNRLMKNQVSEDLLKFGNLQQADNGLFVLPFYPTSIADNTGDAVNGTSTDALGNTKVNADIGHIGLTSILLPPTFLTDAYVNYPENKEKLLLESLALNENITYSLTGGEDLSAFQLTAAGALSFINQPQLGIANDADQDNVYKVEVTVSDGSLSSSQLFELAIVGAELNVVMIVLDDLNDYIGFMGGHLKTKTPNIDRLASQGVSFMNAHSNAPLCDPSRASFLNGILPMTSQHFGTQGSNWKNNEVLKESKLISEYFMDNAYTTYKSGKITHSTSGEDKWWDYVHANSQDYGPVAYNGKSGAIHSSSIHQLADVGGSLDGVYGRLSDIPTAKRHQQLDDASGFDLNIEGWYSTITKEKFNYTSEEDRDLMPDEKNTAWTIANIEALDAQDSDDPFFMALGIIRPHSPFVVPDKYFDMFPLEEIELPKIYLDDREDFTYDLSSRGHEIVDALEHSHVDKNEGLKKYFQGYLASVAFADDMVGRVMDAVENSQYANNTVIMLFSDHGYLMGEKDYAHKNNLWEHSTRVPLIIKSPLHTTTQGQQVDHPVSLIDIYPTLKDLCYLEGDTKFSELGADLDGHSLKPFLSDVNSSSFEGDEVALSVIGNWFYKTVDRQNYGIKSKRFRYINRYTAQNELYDHLYDQDEFINVIDHPAYTEVKAAFEEKLENKLRPNAIVNDEMDDLSFPQAYEFSSNWRTTRNTWGVPLDNDPSLIQKELAGQENYITYEVTNPGVITFETWAALVTDGTSTEKVLQDVGTWKVYVSEDNTTWTDITLNEIIGGYTWDSNVLTYENASSFPAGTKFIKIAIEGDGNDFAAATLGKIRIYENADRNILLDLDNINVSVDASTFAINAAKIRTSNAIMPIVSDDFSTSNHYLEKSGNTYLTNDEGVGFHEDGQRFVRSDTAAAYVTYQVENIGQLRIEGVEVHSGSNHNNNDTVLVDHSIEVLVSTDNINFQPIQLRSISLHIDDIYNSGVLDQYRHSHKFAWVSHNQIPEGTQYIKVAMKTDGDTQSPNGWNFQLNGVYFYDDYLISGSAPSTEIQDQTITIDNISNKLTTDTAFDVVASTTSGLDLTYEITGPATISGKTITLTGAEGEVIVTVLQAGNEAYNPASKSISFNVTNAIIDPEITLNISALTLNVGDEYQLVTYITPIEIANTPLIWTSDNTNAITVGTDGLITAVGGGIATVSVTIEGYEVSASATIISESSATVGKPTNIVVNPQATSATISFTEGANATFHRIEYKPEGKGWIMIDSVMNDNNGTYELGNLLPNTNYTLRMRAINSTSLSSWSSQIIFTTSSSSARLNTSLNKQNISIYPNPADGSTVNISSSVTANNITIEVYNALGQLEKSTNANNTSKVELKVNGLNKGIYFVKIVVDGKGFSEKLILN